MNHLPLLVRREFWEHRSFFIAPAVVAAILLIGATFGHIEFGNTSLNLLESPEFASKHYGIVTGILSALAIPYLICMGFVIIFYLLDSLYADRKDRSVMFWKSLPVSDRETVISKLVVAALVIPLLTFVAVLVTNLLFGVIESVRLSDSIEHVWKVVWIPRAWFSAHALLLYALVVMMLWYLPILAWFLLVSAWARRAVILWAVLPPLALMFLEKVLFDTGYVASLLRDRFIGWFSLAIDRSAAAEHSMTFDGERIPMTSRLSDTLDPASFFSSPGLWLGLAAAVVMVWGAILLRRRRSET